ncbi:hypothetical protein ACPYO6_13885 [Georgenia sp. Z1344]|uniref:hypothetical protein n=1 Tax=Georgenia sp. Z1344 TaxID=3416706 RepID=UPI003CF57B32
MTSAPGEQPDPDAEPVRDPEPEPDPSRDDARGPDDAEPEPDQSLDDARGPDDAEPEPDQSLEAARVPDDAEHPSADDRGTGPAPRRIRPTTTRAAVLWMIVGVLVGALVPAFALAWGTNSATGVVREAVDAASPVGTGRHELAGESTYLIVGERGTTGQCVVTGPDGSSLDIELEEVFQAGGGSREVSLGSFAAGSDGTYDVDCDAGGADLGITQSPSLGGWSVMGAPLVVGILGLLAGFAIGLTGLFAWIKARQNRWNR